MISLLRKGSLYQIGFSKSSDRTSTSLNYFIDFKGIACQDYLPLEYQLQTNVHLTWLCLYSSIIDWLKRSSCWRVGYQIVFRQKKDDEQRNMAFDFSKNGLINRSFKSRLSDPNWNWLDPPWYSDICSFWDLLVRLFKTQIMNFSLGSPKYNPIQH